MLLKLSHILYISFKDSTFSYCMNTVKVFRIFTKGCITSNPTSYSVLYYIVFIAPLRGFLLELGNTGWPQETSRTGQFSSNVCYKGKGSPKDCSIYRGITLLSVFATVLLMLKKVQLPVHRRTEQSGFTPGRSTIDRIITLNTVIQSNKEFHRLTWIAFVDLKAAFDSVDRKALWKLLRSLGLYSKFVDLVEALYTDTCSCVCADGVLSDWFTVGSGVRQRCRIAPDLFLGSMDHTMECTAHRGMTGVT